MKKFLALNKKNIFLLGIAVLAGVFLLVGTQRDTVQASDKKVSHQQAYQVYSQRCLGCHDSVADPEKPGRTRDDWHLVVNVMHGYGFDLSDQEAEMIIDLLYDLRKGMEREAG
jgi:hypothetical protein